MKKIIFFFFFSRFFLINLIAQEIDYVINNPDSIDNNLIKAKAFKIPNPDYTSYFLNSTAYTLKSRDIRISGTDLIFAKGSYGLTNNTMASVSISLIGTLVASIKQQVHLNEDIKLAFSVSFGQLLSVPKDSMIFFGGGQTMVTVGDIQNNITVGTGFYYSKSTFDIISEEKEFFLSNLYCGVQKQLSRRVYIILEGIYFWNYNVFSGAAGVKIIIKKEMSLNIGVMPIAWKDPNLNRSNIDGNILPIISFRMLLDRH
jgi:hypothetical protein